MAFNIRGISVRLSVFLQKSREWLIGPFEGSEGEEWLFLFFCTFCLNMLGHRERTKEEKHM